MFRKSALISLSALLLAMPGQSETLQQALERAFQTNPALAAQRADVGVAREQLTQARGARAPTIDLSGSATFESLDSNQPIAFNTGENTLASAQLRATLPVYTGGQINAGIAQAKAGILAADAQFDGVAQDLILNVVTAYVDVLRDRTTGKIFIVDANKTDMGPPIALQLGSKLRATRRMAKAFAAAYVDK